MRCTDIYERIIIQRDIRFYAGIVTRPNLFTQNAHIKEREHRLFLQPSMAHINNENIAWQKEEDVDNLFWIFFLRIYLTKSLRIH